MASCARQPGSVVPRGFYFRLTVLLGCTCQADNASFVPIESFSLRSSGRAPGAVVAVLASAEQGSRVGGCGATGDGSGTPTRLRTEIAAVLWRPANA